MKIFLTCLLTVLTTLSFSQTERVYTKIEPAPVITTENASTYTSYENTLESVLNYFYASRIRKDSEWKKVVKSPENKWERLQFKWNKRDKRTIAEFYLISKTEHAPGKFWVRVEIEIAADKKTISGGYRVEAEVQLIDGKWMVTIIPTT